MGHSLLLLLLLFTLLLTQVIGSTSTISTC
jgi:hypothetical protein